MIRRFLVRRSVIVASASLPFSGDRTRSLAAALADALRHDGFRVDWVDLPISDRPEDAHDQRAAIDALDLRDTCGMLVCLGSPAFLLSHANKRVWITDSLPTLDPGEVESLRSASRLFAGSASLASELSRAYGLKASALDTGTEPAAAACRLIA